MRLSDRRTRLFLLTLVAAVAVSLPVVGYERHWLQSLELETHNARFAVRGDEPPPKDTVIVAIDDRTLDELHENWPIDRAKHARMIDLLRLARPRAIGYDVDFSTPGPDPAATSALIRAVHRTPGIVVASSRINDANRPVFLGGEDAVLRHGGKVSTTTAWEEEADGQIRRMLPEVNGVEPFPVAVASRAGGRPVDTGGVPYEGAWIDYRAGPDGVPSYSFSRVLEGRVNPDVFAGKTVLVGGTDISIEDLHPAPPRGQRMTGVEIGANAMATALDGFPLADVSNGIGLLIVIVLAFAVPLLTIRLSGARPLLLGVALLGLFLVGAQLLFESGHIVPVVMPVLGLVIGTAGASAVELTTGVRERRRIRQQLERFAPKQIVDELLKRSGNEPRIPGQRREATILFCDLRGFTAFAAGVEPEQVMRALDRYHEAMGETLLDHGGTLVSIMGDGLMAVFGAPEGQPDHADRAVAAARDMAGPRLAQFNDALRKSGIDKTFGMGVGIATGDIQSGTVGTRRRLDYAAVGDTTNLASRLEGMTKDANVPVLIAQSTRDRMADPDAVLTPVGELTPRGRNPVFTWTLSAEGGLAAATGGAPGHRDVGRPGTSSASG